MTEQENPIPVSEPSVWDYVVSKLKFWDRDDANLPAESPEMPSEKAASFSWWSLLALGLALTAQVTLEPSPGRTAWAGVILYAGALVCLVMAIFRKEWRLPNLKPDAAEPLKISFKLEALVASVILAIFAFLFFGNGEFGWINTALWVSSVGFFLRAFWKRKADTPSIFQLLRQRIKQNHWQVTLTRWTLIVLAAVAVILFFNFYRLEAVPPEMVSDQAEKLLDINDILQGARSVYFPRNTGREVLHFYLTAAYMAVFNLDVSFLNLKVVAVFANLATLIFIYFLGKEIGNKWVGLSAALFAGIAYWPLLFTRLALRIPYYPLFVAPVMYFLIRGLRRQNINDIMLTGLFLGLGLHGYTPFRIVPIFVVIGVLVYILHKPAKDRRLQALFSLVLITLVSLLVFIPLLRYWLANPALFGYRAFSRLTGMETGFQTSPVVIFFQNFWKASLMFFWDNGTIWAHSIPGRPALEVVTAGLYFLGIGALVIRYFRKRQWIDLFLLVSIPMLLMPSILSLAYPGENPSLNRTAGAVVPVFVVVGLAFETTIRSLCQGLSGRIRKIAAGVAVVVLVLWSGANNYDLVFRQYDVLYTASSWNTSEIGRVARFFIESLGSPETTFVVGYPHWVDSRLVAINAGQTGMDFAILPDRIDSLPADGEAKIFFLNVNDTESMQRLKLQFPEGFSRLYESEVENKDFMIFWVPSSSAGGPDGG